MSTTNTTPTDIDQPVPGLTVQRIMDGQIIVFTVRDVSRTAADAWVNALDAALSAWPIDKPFLALYDINFPGAAITSYVRAKLSAVVEKFRNISGRTAVVLPKSMTVMLLQLLFRGRAQGKRQRRVFTDHEQAMNWLKEMLNESGNGKA